MPRVGNHPNTLRMHPTLSRHSIKPIQTSRLPEPMRRGPCFILFLYFHPLSHPCHIGFQSYYFFSIFYYTAFNSPSTCRALLRLPTSTSPSSLLPPPTPRPKPPSSPPAA